VRGEGEKKITIS